MHVCTYLDKILFINGWVLGLARGIAEEVVSEFLLCILIGVTYLRLYHQREAAASVREEARELVSEGMVTHTSHYSTCT